MGADIVERLAAVKDKFPPGSAERKAVWSAIVALRAADNRDAAGVVPAWIATWMADREILPDDDGDGISEGALVEALNNHERELLNAIPITPAAVPAGEAVADALIEAIAASSHPAGEYQRSDIVVSMHAVETALRYAEWDNFPPSPKESPQPADGEAVAWIKPDWQNPANYDGKSPVCTYPQAGWIPLYTTPPAQVQAAPKEGLLSLVSSWRDYAECNERAAGELTSSALTAMRSEGRAIAATKCANELEATLQHRGDSRGGKV